MINKLKLLIINRIYILNADGFYLVKIRNTNEKINENRNIELTKKISIIKGFEKMIIINSDSYLTFKNENGKIYINNIKNIDKFNCEMINKKLLKYPMLNFKIELDIDIVKLIYSIEETRKYLFCLVLDDNNKIKFIQEISKVLISNKYKNKYQKLFEIYKRMFNGSKVILITESNIIYLKIKSLVDNKSISGVMGYVLLDNNIIFYDKYQKNHIEKRIYL